LDRRRLLWAMGHAAAMQKQNNANAGASLNKFAQSCST
jgi:hypothetical protein